MEFNFKFKLDKYEDFKTFIENEILNILPEKYARKYYTLTRTLEADNENLEMICFFERKGLYNSIMEDVHLNIPTLPIKQLYSVYKEEGIDKLLNYIIFMLNHSTFSPDNIDEFKQNIRPLICKTDGNEELLSASPSRNIFGLSLYYVLVFEHNNCVMSCQVTNEIMDRFELTEQDLYNFAIENNKKYFDSFCIYDEIFKSIDDVNLKEVGNIEDGDMAKSVFTKLFLGDIHVVHHTNGLNGASFIADFELLDDVAEEMDNDILIAPIYKEELICLPYSHMFKDIKIAKAMIKTFKQMLAGRESNEPLTDSIYLYKRADKNLYLYTGEN